MKKSKELGTKHQEPNKIENSFPIIREFLFKSWSFFIPPIGGIGS
jgi:hypothetical protein